LSLEKYLDERNSTTHLDKGLNLVSCSQLLLTHTFRHFSWVAFDACNDGVGIWSLFCALIQLSDDNDLLSCLATL
jgi:hypothetical protein